MYVVVNAKGEVETEIATDSFPAVQAAVETVYPKHTPVFTVEDQDAESLRSENPVPATPELAMLRSGLPWRPTARRPGPGDLRGVGVTMAEVLARYPLTKAGLERAHEDLLPNFPNTPKEFGYTQWSSASGMARRMLKSNAKTTKAVQGVGTVVPPSYAVGINLLPFFYGKKVSMKNAGIAAAAYYAKKGAPEMPIDFKSLPLVAPKLMGHGEGHRSLVTLCVGSSAECRRTCLAFTGQNAAVAYNDYSKLFMTRALFFQPLAFCRMLIEAIDEHVQQCRRGVKFSKDTPAIKTAPYIRLNVYSDIPWELFFPEIFDYCAKIYPDLWCYDYTKIPGRGPLPKSNYNLTFSYSGKNLDECKAALRSGQRIAVVFLRRTAKGSQIPDPKTGEVRYQPAEPVSDITFLGKNGRKKSSAGVFEGWPVIDGDEYDMRPKDPTGVVVGLRYKIPQKLDIQQKILLQDGTELIGKVKGKTGGLVSIRLEDGRNIRIEPDTIRSLADDFVLVPPSQTSKFLVHAQPYKNQWIFGVNPSQTNVDLESEINENEDLHAAAQ